MRFLFVLNYFNGLIPIVSKPYHNGMSQVDEEEMDSSSKQVVLQEEADNSQNITAINNDVDVSLQYENKPQRKLQQTSSASKSTRGIKDRVESKFRDPCLQDLQIPNTKISLPVEAFDSDEASTESTGQRTALESPVLLDLERLVSRHIEIYWDGDRVFYPCTVIKALPPTLIDPAESQYAEVVVLYENDDSNEEYTEKLSLSAFVRRQSPRFSTSSALVSSNPSAVPVPVSSLSKWRIWDDDDDDEYEAYLVQLKKRGSQVVVIFRIPAPLIARFRRCRGRGRGR